MTKMILSPFSETITADGSNNLDSANPTGAGGAPLAPTNFTAPYLSDTSLLPSWTDNATNELNYELGRSPNGTDTWTALSDPAANATSAPSTGLTVDTQYFYRLRAVNAAGNSSYATANGTTTAGVTSTPNLFSDSFESADLSASAATLNANNFAWTDANRSSILHQDGASAWRDFPVAYIQEYTDGRDVTAKTGTYSMGIEYAANVEMAEQRFSYNAAPELWVRYWVRVPENYSHGTVGTNDTSKFLALWNTTYQAGVGGGATVWLSMFDDGSNGSTIGFTHMDGNTGSDIAYAQIVPFISVPADRGRWMQMAVRVKTETSLGAANGIIETYRRWDGESSFTQLHSKTNATLNEQTGGFLGGYVLGWANSAYAADTWFLVDDFEMSTGSLI